MNRFSVHLKDAQESAVEQIVDESKKDDQIPEMSKSEAIRKALTFWLEESGRLMDLVDEETIIRLQREQFLDEKASVTNWRTGFETRVKDNFKRRFENGYKPEQLVEFATNMRREAEILWPEWADEDYQERREAALDYVDDVLESAIEAAETSTHDPLDPDTIFEGYGGVEEGMNQQRAAERVDGELVDDAVRLLSKGEQTTSYTGSQTRRTLTPEQTVEKLAQRVGVSDAEAKAAVEVATTRLGIDAGDVEGPQEAVSDD